MTAAAAVPTKRRSDFEATGEQEQDADLALAAAGELNLSPSVRQSILSPQQRVRRTSAPDAC